MAAKKSDSLIMTLFHKLKSYIPRRNNLLVKLQGLTHSYMEQGAKAEVPRRPMVADCGEVDQSKWRKVDSRALGIKLSMIPDSSRIVLKILQNEGYDAYLVGGCVRDLLLNRTPKDFDVITTAKLGEIKKKFHRALIVGRKFPICLVHVRGSAIEVSSFETVASHSMEKGLLSEMPKGYDEKDFMRWRNSLHRDFTVNSLFYDPFAQKIYDYTNGMADLKAMKLRTLVPADLSFAEDAARILRGLRIAARLGFSFVNDTEKAIRTLCSSLMTLDKARIMMEMNYMLSYGASEPSLILLRRFNLLELLLPFHGAYFAERSGTQAPSMLMKLFFNLDKVVSCDQPCNSRLWVSLLAFHLALVNCPQDALVVWTFSSVMYHGNWKEGVKAARALSARNIHFTPEILNTLDDMTDEELAQRVSKFSSIVIDSVDALINSESLCKVMAHYTSSLSSPLVFISHNAGKAVEDIFDVLVDDLESLSEERHYYSIDYKLLGKGDMLETRFVLGKIIMDTMRSGIINSQTTLNRRKDKLYASTRKVKEVTKENMTSLVLTSETPECKVAKRGLAASDYQQHRQETKKQKHEKQMSELEQKLIKEKLKDAPSCQDIAKKRNQLRKVVVKDVKRLPSQEKVTLNNVKHCEGQDIHHLLGKVPKSVEQCRTQSEILGVLASIPNIDKQHTIQAPEVKSSVLERAPQLKKQRDRVSKGVLNLLEKTPEMDKQNKSQAPEVKLPVPERALELKKQREQVSKGMVNVLRLSNIFTGDKHPAKEDVGAGKQPRVKDQRRDGSEALVRTRKLSSIFK